MKRNPFLTASLSALALLTANSQAADDDLLKAISSDVDFAVHLSDLSDTRKNWEKSPMKTFVENPEIQKWWQELLADAEDEVPTGSQELLTELKKEACAAISMLEDEAVASIDLAEVNTALIQRFQKTMDGEDKSAKLQVLLDTVTLQLLGEVKDEDPFKAQMEKVFAKFGELVVQSRKEDGKEESIFEIAKEKVGGIEVTKLYLIPKGGEKTHSGSFGIVDGKAYLTLGGTDDAALQASLKNGAAKAVTDLKTTISAGEYDFQLLGNLSNLWQGMATGIEFGLEASGMKDQLQINVKQGWDAIGFNQLEALTYAFDLSEKDLVVKAKMTAPTKGLVGAAIPEDAIDKLSQMASAKMMGFSQAKFDIPGFYDEFMKMAGAVSPMAPMMFGMQLNKVEGAIGVKIREDLLEHLGDELETAIFDGAGTDPENPFAGMGLRVSLKDQAKFEASLKTAFGKTGMKVQDKDFMGETLHMLQLPEGKNLIYAFYKGDLFLGAEEDNAVQKMIQQLVNPGPLMWEMSELSKYKGLFKKDLASISVTDVGTQVKSTLKQFEAMGMKDDLPDLSKAEFPFSYSISAGVVEDGVYNGDAVFIAK